MLDLQEFTAIVIVAAPLTGAMSWIVTSQLRAFRNEVKEWRAKDKLEIREWLDGSYMRSAEVVQYMRAVEQRLERMEQRGEQRLMLLEGRIDELAKRVKAKT